MAANVSFGVVAKEKQIQLVAEAVLAKTVRNVSPFAVKGASTVDFPKMAAGKAYIVALTAAITASNANYSTEQLTLSKLGYLFEVNVNVDKQNIFDAVADSVDEGLRAMAREIDADIYGKMKTAALADLTLQVTATSSIYDDFIDMSKIQSDNQVPGSNRYWAVNNADYAKLLRTKEFTRFDAVGRDKISSGEIGEILGATIVRMTDSVVCTHTIAYHREAAAWAIQGDLLLMEAGVPATGLLTCSLNQNYGSKVLQAGKLLSILVPDEG